LSGSFKKIDKTYQELKEERMRPSPESEGETKLKSAPELESEPEEEEVPEPEPEPEPEEEAAEPELKPEPEKEVISDPEPVIKEKELLELKLEPVPAMEPAIEPAAETVDAAITLTVSGLVSEYESDVQAAEAKFSNRVLRLTGIIERVEVKQNLSVNYLVLTADDKVIFQGVRCNFGMQYSSEIGRLNVGQTVTVQGRYDGSIINMSLRDCTLIN